VIDRNHLAPRRIIDVGCGTGRVASLIADKYGADVEGYDISPQAIGEATSKYGSPRLRFLRGAVADAPCDYDLGTLLDVLEHVEDYIGFLRETRRHAPRWIMHIPLDLTVFSALHDGHMHSRAALGHLHYFSESSALATLEYCGFTVRDVIHTCGFMQHFKTKRTWRAMPLMLPRLALFGLSPRLCARLLGGVSLMVLAERREDAAEGSGKP